MCDAAEEVGYMTREVSYPNFSAQAECAAGGASSLSNFAVKLRAASLLQGLHF